MYFLRLLLTAATPLLQSRNSAVVVAVVNLFIDLAPASELTLIVAPLVALATCERRETKFLSMQLLQQLTHDQPHLVAPYVKNFAVFWADPEPLALLKVQTLAAIAIGASGCAHQIVRELETLSTWDRPVLAASAVKALGIIACKSDLAQLCLPKLLCLLNDPRELVSGRFKRKYTLSLKFG